MLGNDLWLFWILLKVSLHIDEGSKIKSTWDMKLNVYKWIYKDFVFQKYV